MRVVSIFLFLLFFSFLFSQGPLTFEVVHEEIIDPGLDHFDGSGATLIEISPEVFLGSWYGGKVRKEGEQRKQAIWISRYEGGRWLTPKMVFSCDKPCWNPVLFSFGDEILLFYKIGRAPHSCIGMVMRSFDNGKSWQKEEVLPAGILGPIRSKPLLTREKRLLCPSSLESGLPTDLYKTAACWIDSTEDRGRTWSKIGPLRGGKGSFGIAEPALFLDHQNGIRLFAREYTPRLGKGGLIWSSLSTDEGRNWKEPYPTKIPNPGSSFEILSLRSGVLLLIYNPSMKKRAPLQMDYSVDGGNVWNRGMTVEGEEGEYSDVASVESSGGKIHILYSHTPIEGSPRNIKHVVVEVAGL